MHAGIPRSALTLLIAAMLATSAGALAADGRTGLVRAYAAMCQLVRPGTVEDGMLGCLTERLAPEDTAAEIVAQVDSICGGLDNVCASDERMRGAVLDLKAQGSSCSRTPTPHCGDSNNQTIPTACAEFVTSIDASSFPQAVLHGRTGDALTIGPTVNDFAAEILSGAQENSSQQESDLRRRLGEWCAAYRERHPGPPTLHEFGDFLNQTDRAAAAPGGFRMPQSGGVRG